MKYIMLLSQKPKSSLSLYRRSAFTLIELLVVIAIIAVLAIVVILVLNPAGLLQQSRDSNRFSDLSNLNNAINIFTGDNPGSGSGNLSTTYISIIDSAATTTAGTNCSGIGFPSSSGQTYTCSSSSSKNAAGTGWLPINFKNISFGSPLSNLPLDPVNATSSGLYYTYTPGAAGKWDLAAGMESSKYRLGLSETDGGESLPSLEVGPNLRLTPTELLEFNRDPSLLTYWPFDEGAGTTVYDASDLLNNGTWSGTPSYAAGKVGAYAGQFTGPNSASTTNPISIQGTSFTLALWVQSVSAGDQKTVNIGAQTPFTLSATHARYCLNTCTAGSTVINDGAWHFVAVEGDGTGVRIYLDGNGTPEASGPVDNATISGVFCISGCGNGGTYSGLADDVRLYSRTLTVAEIQAIYAGTK